MYFPQLNFTRYIAAMIVVFFHFAGVKEVMAIPVLGRIIYNGNSLLSYFFVLTGFVLVMSLSRTGVSPAALPARPFWLKRVARIYPLHWLALGLTIALRSVQAAYDPATYTFAVEPVKLMAHLTLLQAWYPEYPFALVYNYVSWTLCVDLFLTMLAPVLYGWMVRQPTRALLRRVGLVWVGSLGLHAVCIRNGMPLNWGFYWPPFHIPEFMLGLAGGLIVVRHYKALKPWNGWLHLLSWTGIGLALLLTGMGLSFIYKNSLFFAPFYLLTIINLCLSDNLLTRLFCTRPLQYLGKISYTIFILQLPVALAVLYFFKEAVGWQYRYVWPLFALALIGASALAYELMEKPITRSVNRFFRRQLMAGAGPVLRADSAVLIPDALNRDGLQVGETVHRQ